MTTDLATLGLRIESGDADMATRRLDHLATASNKAERAADGLTSAHTKAGRSLAALTGEARGMASAMAAIDGPLGGVASRMRALVTTVSEAGVLFGGVALGIAAVGFSARSAIEKTIAFQNGMAEVSTLVDTTKVSMQQLTKAVLAQSDAFAAAPTDEAKALYQIISAGATNAKEATEYLTAANKLALGGITDIFTAADGLTSIMNAYAGRVKNVQAVSDSLFVAMRDGKTTIGELASSLGRVAPIAAQTGVSLDELDAAIAAITTGGINTDEAVTGLRDILTAIVHPTTMAKKEAALLGLQFNTTALQAEGLQKFLENLMAKTHANADVLAALFGNVRGIIPILSLAGAAGQKFNQIMDDMAHKTGATADAVNKMKTPGYEMERMFRAASNEAIKFSSSAVMDLGPAFKTVADNMDQITHAVTVASEALFSVFVARLLGRYIPAMAQAAAAQAQYTAAILSGNAVEIGSAQAEAMRAKAVADGALADLEAARAVETRLTANVAGLRAALARADSDRAQIGITNLLTASEGRLAAATDAVAAATVRATAATEAYDAALAETGIMARLSAAAVGTLDTALAFFGGPIGAAILGLSAAFYELYERSQLSARAMASTNDQMIQAAINADQADISMLKYISSLVQYAKLLQMLPGFGPSFAALGDLTQGYISQRINSLTQDTNRLIGHQAHLIQPVTITPQVRAFVPPSFDNSWTPPSGATESRKSIMAREISNLNAQGQADRVSGPNRDAILEELKIEAHLRSQLKSADKNLTEQQLNDLSKLNPAEAALISKLVLRNDAWKEQSKILDGINKQVSDYLDTMKALDALKAQHKITPLEFSVAQAGTGLNKSLLGIEAGLGHGNPFGVSAQIGLAAGVKGINNQMNQQLETLKQAQDAGIKGVRSYAAMEVEIHAQAAAKIQALYTQMYHSQLLIGEDTFSKLADAVAGFAGKSSAAYRVLFGISKAFAIADATIKIQQALAKALAAPFPSNLADWAIVISQGASIIQSIESVAGFATGVINLNGPGTATSDSIMARLSAGESVVTAAGTQGNESTLAAMNAGAKFDAMTAHGGATVSIAPVINVDARYAQQGMAEQLRSEMIVAVHEGMKEAVAEAKRQAPSWVAKANSNPRKR
ncbi:MAG: phage tail tape measure protein [Alphaproteobacteria bacterium]|nr:phage tail tape measure protein [Alphaproteobacteria bacterium]